MTDFGDLLSGFGVKKGGAAMGAGGGMGVQKPPAAPKESTAADAKRRAFGTSQSMPIRTPSAARAVPSSRTTPYHPTQSPSRAGSAGLGGFADLLDGFAGTNASPSKTQMMGSPGKMMGMRASSPNFAGSSSPAKDPVAAFADMNLGATATPTGKSDPFGDLFAGGATHSAPTPTAGDGAGLDDLLGLGVTRPAPMQPASPLASGGSANDLEDMLGDATPMHRASSAPASRGSANDLEHMLSPTPPSTRAPNPDGLDDSTILARNSPPFEAERAGSGAEASAGTGASSDGLDELLGMSGGGGEAGAPSGTGASSDGLDDLLGMSGDGGEVGPPSPNRAPSTSANAGDELADLLGGASTCASSAAPPGDADLLGAFGGTDTSPAQAAEPAPSTDFASLDDLGGGSSTKTKGGGDSFDDMMGWTGESAHPTDVPAPASTPAGPKQTAAIHVEVVKIDPSTVDVDCVRGDDEPEERFKARKARLQRVKARELESLAQKKAVEAHEEQEKQEHAMLREMVGKDLDEWVDKHKGNIRGLLGSMHEVLWEGAKWKAANFSDLIDPSGVKKAYRRAIIVVHPDKVVQRGADTHVRYVAGKVFDSLKTAWIQFEKAEM